ncbi:MAG: radical SAM protein [archaeon]
MLEKKVDKHDFRVLITYPNYSMMLTPSYAVGLFTSILREQGYNVDLFDCTPYMASYEASGVPNPVTSSKKLMAGLPFNPEALFGAPKTDLLGDFARTLDSFRPHSVVFSTVVEDTWPQTRDLLKILSHYPEIKSIVGGVYTTMAPKDVIADSYVQCVGEGEGEHTIAEFCETVRNGILPIRIPGTFAKGEDGQVIRNLSRLLVNMDETPIPDFSLFDKRRFSRPLGAKIWNAIPIETYRGCPYTCTFCNSPAQARIAKENQQGIFARRKSMPTLQREITTLLEKNNGNFLYINDDAFMARPKKEIIEFAKMYKDIRIPFWFQTRFENIDEEHLNMLQDVGAYRISFGLEHGNEQFRREKLHRNISNEKMVEKSKIVAGVGIPYSVNVILGMPYETRDLVFDTIQLNRELGGFDSVAPNIFTPYHGTPLREMAINEGWLDSKRQTNSFVGGSILQMPSPYLQPDEMIALQGVYNFYVTLPESRWPDIERVERASGSEVEIASLRKSLSDEFYMTKYGTTEAERMLTYAG